MEVDGVGGEEMSESLSHLHPVADAIQSWHVQHSKPDVLPALWVGDGAIEPNLICNFVEAIGDSHRRVSCEEPGGG